MSPYTQSTDVNPEHALWIHALTGELGPSSQQEYCTRLASYLYVVAYNCLVGKRQNHQRLLIALDEELSTMAQDYVQQFMIKMMQDNYALLAKYSGRSKFTMWAAQVVNNMIRSELRRAVWNRCHQLDDHTEYIDPDGPRFTQNVQKEQLLETLGHCLDQLPAPSRIVLVRCIMQGESASDVARDLDRTLQGVYNLANRAKKQLMALLSLQGIDSEDLAVFGN